MLVVSTKTKMMVTEGDDVAVRRGNASDFPLSFSFLFFYDQRVVTADGSVVNADVDFL